MPLRLTGAVIAALCLIAPAQAQDERFPGWHNRMTGYVSSKEPRWAVASWYGPGFHGRRTASGERFNANALTCAHRTATFGTRFRVTHRGHSTVCRVNDRGPFVRGRSIDLSAASARAIHMSGVGRVTIQRI
jgi:rare lipoprotein A